MTSDLVFQRLSIGVTRERLAEASGLSSERLRLAEDGVQPLTEAEEAARRAGLRRLVDEALAGAAEPAQTSATGAAGRG